jgi:hypothetical protein
MPPHASCCTCTNPAPGPACQPRCTHVLSTPQTAPPPPPTNRCATWPTRAPCPTAPPNTLASRSRRTRRARRWQSSLQTMRRCAAGRPRGLCLRAAALLCVAPLCVALLCCAPCDAPSVGVSRPKPLPASGSHSPAGPSHCPFHSPSPTAAPQVGLHAAQDGAGGGGARAGRAGGADRAVAPQVGGGEGGRGWRKHPLLGFPASLAPGLVWKQARPPRAPPLHRAQPTPPTATAAADRDRQVPLCLPEGPMVRHRPQDPAAPAGRAAGRAALRAEQGGALPDRGGLCGRRNARCGAPGGMGRAGAWRLPRARVGCCLAS